MRYAAYFTIILLAVLAVHAQAPSKVSATVLCAAALHGYHLDPLDQRAPLQSGVTMFCTVVVDNNSGRELEGKTARVVSPYRPGATNALLLFPVFLDLGLAICDDAGKGLESCPYSAPWYGGMALHALPEGRSTNQLRYFITNAPTNKVIGIRLEGSIGFAGAITSNIVKARIY
jgi:hypothetical protein